MHAGATSHQPLFRVMDVHSDIALNADAYRPLGRVFELVACLLLVTASCCDAAVPAAQQLTIRLTRLHMCINEALLRISCLLAVVMQALALNHLQCFKRA